AENLSLDEFWVFSAFPPGHIHEFFKALSTYNTADAVERALDLPPGTVSMQLLRLRRSINRSRRQAQTKVRFLDAERQPFRLCGGRVTVHVLTPSHDSCWSYTERLTQAIRALHGARPRVLEVPHNQASAALLF